MTGLEKRGRGRPRKYLPNSANDFETNKYESFFNFIPNRIIDQSNAINVDNVVNVCFDFVYNNEYKNNLYNNNVKSYKDIFILDKLYTNKNIEIEKDEIINKEKKLKNCNEIFYEYLQTFKSKTNENYFILMVKFILLFYECFNLNKSKEKKDVNINNINNNEENKKIDYSNLSNAESLPELCNEFYSEFMEPNNFFNLNNENEMNEILDLIQHFCIWLFKNEYTKSKLSLANN